MPQQLTAVERKRIAAACGWAQHGAMGIWNPEHSEVLWQALVHTCAGLIEAMKDKYYEYMNATNPPTHKLKAVINWTLAMCRLNTALATNDVSAIEAILLELLEQKL